MDNIIEWPESGGIEEEAAQWVILLDGEEDFSEENRLALIEWLSRSVEHREILKKFNTFWADNSLTELLEPSLASVAAKSELTQRSAFSFRKIWQPVGAIAAVLMVSFVTLFTVDWQSFDRATMNGPYSTAVGQQKRIELADGSVMELNTNSQLIVEYEKGSRNIHLIQGEVHFSVAKNPSSPFRVYARNSRVQAVGTAFTVYLADKEIEVYVTEGRVALAGLQALASSSIADFDSDFSFETKKAMVDRYAESKVQELGTLDTGRGAILKIDNSTQESVAEKLLEVVATPEEDDIARRLAWRNGLLIFTGETLEQVVAEIRRYTTVQIELVSPEVREIEIAGQVHVSDTESMFKALESNFGLKVTRLGYNRVQVTVQ